MALQIPPYAGQILMCDYSGFIIPEMVKKRPVIVISPKPRRNLGLCLVVPLSTTQPHVVKSCHLLFSMPEELVRYGGFKRECWVKCDIINTLSYQRLSLIRLGKGYKVGYSKYCLPSEMLGKVRHTVCQGIMGGRV